MKICIEVLVKRNVRMNKIAWLSVVMGASTFLGFVVKAAEIQFTTLPGPVQTTVIHETHIVGPADVVRVTREDTGVYAVTVRKNAGQAIVYVNSAGQIVQPVATQTAIETSAAPTLDTFVHNLDSARYQLLEKKENEEVYLDKQTGTKWAVKVEKKD
jgi:hypothetical protein